LILETVRLKNVPIAVQSPNGTALARTTGSTTIRAWGQGHEYTPSEPTTFEGPYTRFSRPGVLLQDSIYYERSKPLYATNPLSQISSTRTGGSKGDGTTDDTAALQRTILAAAPANKAVFVDAGTYKLTSTLYIPQNSRIVGESYSVFMSSGHSLSDMSHPQPVVSVGLPGERGSIEWSDMIVSTQGKTS